MRLADLTNPLHPVVRVLSVCTPLPPCPGPRTPNLKLQLTRIPQHVFAEDVNVAHCLSVNGVIAYDTRDSNGGERFHPFTPGQHLNWRPPKKRKPDGSSPDWYENYNKPWGLKLGEECCAPDSVSFHYVNPDLMKHMSALLFDCRDHR